MDILKLTDKMSINQRADRDIKSQSRLPNVQEAISWGHEKGQWLHALVPLPSTSRATHLLLFKNIALPANDC